MTDKKSAGAQPVVAKSALAFQFRTAYWAALLMIALMASASYLLLQEMMAGKQRDDALLALATEQKALSQRVVYLVNVATAAPVPEKAQYLVPLREAVTAYEANQEKLLNAADADGHDGSGREALNAALYEAPYHLDYFSVGLAANAWRFVAAVEQQSGASTPSVGYLGDMARANLDHAVADATLKGFSELERQIWSHSQDRLDQMLWLHRALYLATLGLLGLVAWTIFRPMATAIERRTNELVDARNSMAYQAVHDGLTGLHNRAFLVDHFDTVIKSAHRRGERLAVVQFDLDRFKQINDTLGHHAGDFVLVETARRMRETCRASDLCVRLGGDEFVVVLNAAGTSEDISGVTQRILDSINQPISYEGATIQPGASAGIAVYPVDAEKAEDLMVHADLALYSSKKVGGGGYSFFSDELRRELDHRKQLEKDLAVAIAERSFQVHYQPQISLTTGEIAGTEALVRWKHPTRGMVPPSEFIPVAEKSGQMVAIGRIIMEKAISDAAEWREHGVVFGRLAVNVSGAELREADFSAFLFRTLREAGLPAQCLSLEIVESVILDDEQTGIASKLRDIRAAGVHLELDDFGTGYASLSHVNPNEIDRLKIDRRFVQNIHLNRDNTKIVRAITELARGLGISIIAEGAETEAELDLLLAIGCDHVQGYSIAFPMPVAEARDWLVARGIRPEIVDELRKIEQIRA
ncbi:MAG: EAL domain-containing protein [Rhizobiaceae bacterium]|nr:EAL domain-containing protein [Rhizobiaceae bacterium]MCV0406173.1 EAL domain-containing protein [Rhizobiaceae bacterium]